MDASTAPVMHSGGVLKKNKKKMLGRRFCSLTEGYAKRWLIIFEDGTLSYSIKPESESRGIIEVPHASVSSDIRHGMLLKLLTTGTIHVDSGSNVFRT